MIKDDFLVFDEKGLYCKVGNFYLDPQFPVQTAVISHAHGDHAVGGSNYVYCTHATASIMKLRLKKDAGKEFFTFDYKREFELNGVLISFYPAGHILGSAMVLMKYEGVRYLYTGDFKVQTDPTCESLELIEADVFITETTFADPAVKHPDPVQEILKLNNSDHNVLLGAYVLGKTQRIINLITENCPSRTVYLHHSMLAITKLYEDYSYSPGRYEPYNRKLMKTPDKGFVYIVPPLTFNSYFRAKGVLRMFASGWRRLQNNNDVSLYISDHVDWDDLLKSIEVVKPREIWTLHGDGRHLKEHFSGKIPVKILT